jgi:thermitase
VSRRRAQNGLRGTIRVLCALTLLSTGLCSQARAAGDPLRSQQWGLDAIGADAADAISDGSGVTVAVIDTGVDAAHPDLQGSVSYGPDFIAGGDTSGDPNGHGTHVAGIIAAHRDNGIGGAGAAPGVHILAIRVLDEHSSGTTTGTADGVDAAVAAGARVINLSLSAGPNAALVLVPGNRLVESITRATQAGVVVTAAAGNDALPLCEQPVVIPQIICVGAVNQDLQRSSFSNYGLRIDVVAPGGGDPGEAIVSTRPGGAYAGMQGTSQATPFVAAVAAQLSALGLNEAEIVDRILGSARDLGAPGVDAKFGHGLLDARAALASFARPAPPPSLVLGSPRRQRIHTFLRKGLPVRCRLTFSGRCKVSLKLRGKLIGEAFADLTPGQTGHLALRPRSRAARTMLRRSTRLTAATLTASAAGVPARRRSFLFYRQRAPSERSTRR